MAKRKWESSSSHPLGLSTTEVVSEVEYGNSGLARTLDSYLKLAEECMESLEKMFLRNFNNELCDYLVHKLKVVVQIASLFVEAEVHRPGSFVNIARHVETFKLLVSLANQIEIFVRGCCKDAWIRAAMTWTNVAEHVSLIGSNLELCKVALFQQFAATQSLSVDRIVSIINAEVKIVKSKASADVETLLARVRLELNSLKGGGRHLATYLLQRLLRVKGIQASFTPLSPFLSAIDDKSFWGRFFQLVKPAEQIGKGTAATVHKATWLGMPVAKKTFQGHDSPDFIQEVGILGRLCHPNITSMFCCAKDKRSCAIIMELMDEDLYALMQRRLTGNNDSYPFPILEAVDIMLQIGEGVNYLHNQKIVHRDLKSLNILVKSVKARGVEIEYVHAKVADFGISKTKESSVRYSNQTFNRGTYRWMAPEVINLSVGGQEGDLHAKKKEMEKYPFKCDVYSFAMVCYEILTGYEPFHEETSPTIIKQKVLKGERPSLPDRCPPLLKALIMQCWTQEPKERPSFPFICSRLKYLKYLLMTDPMQTSNTSASSQAEGGLVARNTVGHTTNSFTQSYKMPGATTLRLGVNGGCAGLSNASSERDKAPIIASAAMPAQPPQGALKYTKLWEGILAVQKQEKPVPVCKLEGYRQTSAPEMLAADWPPTIQVVRLIGQEYMNNKEYQGKAELLVFRPLSQHGFLGQLHERKLCAVVELPSQTLLLAPDKSGRMLGMLFPGFQEAALHNVASCGILSVLPVNSRL